MKIKVFIFSIILMFIYLLDVDVFAKDYIELTANVKSDKFVSASNKYVIQPVNGEYYDNIPKDVTISFDNINPSSGIITSSAKIDFSNASFPDIGYYEYIVKYDSSTNKDITSDDNTYKIYVVVSNDGIKVVDQVLNLSKQQKCDLVFNHEYNGKIQYRVDKDFANTGIYLFIIPFIILIAISIVGIIFSFKRINK